MAVCPSCGAEVVSGRFCGTCGERLHATWDDGGSGPEPVGPAVAQPTETRADRPERPRAPALERLEVGRPLDPGTEGPAPRDGSTRQRTLVAAAIVGLAGLVGALFVALQPQPEVVSAGRWRGDGTGATSTHAADAELVLWSNRRLGEIVFDQFRPDMLEPLGTHAGLLVAASEGYLIGVDTATGERAWERYTGLARPAMHGGSLLVPLGPGVARIDAATGEESGWFATGATAPDWIVAASEHLVVVAREEEAHGVSHAAYRYDGTQVFAVDGMFAHTWQTTQGPRLILVDSSDPSVVEVDLMTGARSQEVPVPSGGVTAASDGWLLGRDGPGSWLVWLDGGGTTVELPVAQISEATALHAHGDTAVVLGQSPTFRPPPRGNDVVFRIDAGSRSTDVFHLDPGFGEVIGSRPGGLLTHSGSLLRSTAVPAGGPVTRWQQGTDPTRPVQVAGDLVTQFDGARLRAWDADTGGPRFDVAVQGLPGADRRSEALTQPYVRADGFILDSTSTLTQVIDPIDGQRFDIRGSVHVAATPDGDLVRRHDTIALVGADGDTRWEVTVADGIRPGAVELVDDTVAVVDQPADGTVTVRALALADGAPGGVVRTPMQWWEELHRLEGAIVLLGDGVSLIDLTADGPRLRWHTPAVVGPGAIPFTDDDQVALVGGSSVTRLAADTGEVRATERLPLVVHPVVALHDDTVIATSGSDVIALDLRTLEPRWITDVGARVTSAPTLAGDHVYVGTEDGTIVSLTVEGEVTARLDTGVSAPVVGAPTVANGLIFVFADGGRQLVALGPR